MDCVKHVLIIPDHLETEIDVLFLNVSQIRS